MKARKKCSQKNKTNKSSVIFTKRSGEHCVTSLNEKRNIRKSFQVWIILRDNMCGNFIHHEDVCKTSQNN